MPIPICCPRPAQESCTRALGRTSSWRSSRPSSPASWATAAAGASPVPAATALLRATSCSPQSPWLSESTGASSLVTSIISGASFPLETWPASWSYGKCRQGKPAFTLWLALLQTSLGKWWTHVGFSRGYTFGVMGWGLMTQTWDQIRIGGNPWYSDKTLLMYLIQLLTPALWQRRKPSDIVLGVGPG